MVRAERKWLSGTAAATTVRTKEARVRTGTSVILENADKFRDNLQWLSRLPNLIQIDVVLFTSWSVGVDNERSVVDFELSLKAESQEPLSQEAKQCE